MYEVEYAPSDVVEHPKISAREYVPPIPRFVGERREMDAAEKGTWMHKTMELLDNGSLETRQQVEAALEHMRQSGWLPEETASFITVDKVFSFISSPLGKRMREAARQGLLYKEKQFVVGVSPRRLWNREKMTTEEQQNEAEEQIVVQGIIDAFFQEGDKLILVDYKTDWIRPGQEELLRKRYETQLRYYRETLEQLTGTPVAETYLYAFALNQEIPM
jgi:ATP-dependent helicase/nuclease subunit A